MQHIGLADPGQSIATYKDRVVLAVGPYLKEFKPAAPTAIVQGIQDLYGWLRRGPQRPVRPFLKQLSYKATQLLDAMDKEINLLNDRLRTCRLYNLKKGKRGVPTAPTLAFFKTGKTDKRDALCTQENMTAARKMRDALVNGQLKLLTCVDDKLLITMLQQNGLRQEAKQFESRCIKMRFRNLRLGQCAQCSSWFPSFLCGNKCDDNVRYCDQECANEHWLSGHEEECI